MSFTIYADQLNAFFHSYHSDVCFKEHYGGGDLRRMEGNAFSDMLHVWGLSRDYSCSQQSDSYTFRVTNMDTFKQCGIEGYGSLDEE